MVAVVENMFSVSPGVVAKWVLAPVVGNDFGMLESGGSPGSIRNNGEKFSSGL